MGKSFKKETYSDKSYRDKSKEYKRRKNQIKEDYLYDEKTKGVTLTDLGNEKAEKYFHLNNLYDMQNNVKINEGIVITFNAAQSYTSDSISSSLFQKICWMI